MRKKSIDEDRKQQLEAYKVKGQGVTDLHRHLRKEPSTPLVALRRKHRGAGDQVAGTIATSPKEIDHIIRKEYGEIYKGNLNEGGSSDEFAKEYLKRYEKYIFSQEEYAIEPLRGEDVAEVTTVSYTHLTLPTKRIV